jgi:ketosteroid isomerase-like protein
MHYFTEDPLWMIFLGVVVEAVLGVILFSTGRGWVLWAMIGVALLVLLGLGVEMLIVTDREEVERTIDEVIAALEANDVEGVLRHLAPEARRSRRRAQWALGRVEVQKAVVYNLEITVNRLESPPTARARFFGHIAYRDRKGESPYSNYGTKFFVDFRKEGDRWVVTGHSEKFERQ